MNIPGSYKSLLGRRDRAASFARVLGGPGFAKIRLFAQTFSLPRNGAKPRRLKCFYAGHNFSIYCFSFRELTPFLEVFAANEYSGDWTDCRTVLDIGANVGAASLYFWLRFPHARIVAIEPDRDNVERLKLNLAQIPGSTIVQKALADRSGRIPFYRLDGFNLGASLVEKRPGYNEDTVEAVTFEGLLDDLKIDSVDLCKFDIEGAEFGIFNTFLNSARLKQFVGEYHEDLTHKPVTEFLNFFPRHKTQVLEIASNRFICRGMLNPEKIQTPLADTRVSAPQLHLPTV